MFSNITTESPPVPNEKNNIKTIYHRFQSLLKRGTDSMLSSRSTTASDDSFLTPVSSVGDLLAMSPKQVNESSEHPDVISDLLTGNEFDSICDVTMQEVPMCNDSIFIDANSLDYLVKCAKLNPNHDLMDRGRESLFVKFDPLYAKDQRPYTDSLPDSVECDVGYETSSTASVFTENHALSPKSTMSSVAHASKDKPTQVVPPVVNDIAKFNPTQTRSTPVLVRSVSAILAPTQVATDRLISISGTTPPTAAPRSHSPRYNMSAQADRLQSLRIILQKQDQEILQLHQDNRELRSSLQDVEHKYSRRIEELESKVKKLTDERDYLAERENKLLQHVNDKVMSNKQMSIVMEEYEKTISSLIGEQQTERTQLQEIQDKLMGERDQALDHLTSMESSFNDLLAKYEKCKTVILEAKDREKVFVQDISEYEAGMKKYEVLYNNLKKVTSENLSKANETLESIKKNNNVELMKMNATIKKHEIKIASLQESLDQKTRDNDELSRICDQLINEVR